MKTNLDWLIEKHREVALKALSGVGLWCNRPPYPCLHRGEGCFTCKSSEVGFNVREWLEAEYIEQEVVS